MATTAALCIKVHIKFIFFYLRVCFFKFFSQLSLSFDIFSYFFCLLCEMAALWKAK